MIKKDYRLILIGIVSISLAVLCLIPNKKNKEEIAVDSPQYQWYTLKPSLRGRYYGGSQEDFRLQSSEYEKAMDLFDENKSSFHEIMDEMNEIETQYEYCIYFLGNDWKKQIKFVPGSVLLETYNDYFFVFKIVDSKDEFDAYRLYANIDEELYQKILENNKLTQQLNELGKTNEVMQMLFSKEGVWVRLIGPYFEEEVMVELGYVYKGRKEAYIEECEEDMWIDSNWLFYVPYKANIEGRIPLYKKDW